MVLFYSRISTVGQNAKRQIESFKKLQGYEANNVYLDKIQGNVPFLERPEAVKLFNKALENKEVTIIVDSIDRLGRNLIDILKTIELLTANGINLKSNKEGFQTLVNGKENPMAKIVISVMGSIAEMERNRIKERTSEGIKIARAEGKFKGRKIGSLQTSSRLLERHPIIVAKLKKGLSVREIASITNKSTGTIMKVKKILS